MSEAARGLAEKLASEAGYMLTLDARYDDA